MTGRPAAGLLAALLMLGGCASADEDTASADGPAVEVFTNYRGTEAAAFRDVLDSFTEATDIAVRHVGTAAFASRLPQRLRDGDPPEVALVPQPALVEELARDDRIVPLDDVVGDLEATMLSGAATIGVVDGVRHGVWFRGAVKSLLWYRPTAFEDGVAPVPDTLDELLSRTGRLAAQDATPWCLGMESFGATGWVGTDWVEDLVLRLHGPEVYDEWVAGTIPFTDPRIEEAFEVFGEVALTEGSVLGGRRAVLGTPVLDAIDPMLDDPPGCRYLRQGSFQEAALPTGTTIAPAEGDVAVAVLPGVGDEPPPVLASGEIAVAFSDDPATLELLAYLATPDAGAVWASAHGAFTSPHATLDPDVYVNDFERDLARLVAEAEVVRFDGSDQMPTAVGTGSFWRGIVDYASGAPLPVVLEQIQAGYADAG